MAGGGDLIPGLLDALAFECLIRLPYDQLPSISSVCKLWKQEIDSSYFLRQRRSLGLAQTFVVFVRAGPLTIGVNAIAPNLFYHLTLFEPSTGVWTTLPPLTGHPYGVPHFCRIASVGRELVVVGGMDFKTWAPSDAVYIYDFVSGEWRRGARMPGPPRLSFACAATSGSVVLVAGGHDEGHNGLRSALAYDVSRDEWYTLPDMTMERDECHGFMLRGDKFYAIGEHQTDGFFLTAEAFDVASRTWDSVDDDLLENPADSTTSIAGAGGRLYRCAAGKVVVAEGIAWRSVAELPADVREARQLVGWEGGLIVTGSGTYGGPLSAYVLELGGLTWTKVPPEYSGIAGVACCIEV